jgi:anion-transporting  ArsA/GET3 family ATPase
VSSRLEYHLRGKEICICAGSGGVGKTTTSAAIALGLARRGQRVAVVTIDPARRLATSLGLEELDNEPRLVDPELLASEGGGEVSGELWAMMLDAKRTFDELIIRLAPDERTQEEVLGNRIYQELSSAVAGSQEFTAVAKLYDLHRSGRFDVIVLDTPPSRNALDFLDAPTRLIQFFEGRALRVFLTPTGLATRLVGRGASMVFSIFSRVAGVDLMSDLSVFFRALGGLIDGFRERANGVAALLRDPATTFLIITSPEREPSEEAIFFHQKLVEADMPFGGLIVNRVHGDTLGGHTREETAEVLAPVLGDRLAARVAANLADFDVLAERDRRQIERLSRRLGDEDPVLVPHLDADVSDLGALAAVEGHLFAQAREGE